MLKRWYLFGTGAIFFGFAVFLFSYSSLDNRLYHFFHLASTDPLLFWIRRFSSSGSFTVILPLSILLSLYLWAFQSRREAVWSLASLLSCRIVFALVKLAIARVRPSMLYSTVHSIQSAVHASIHHVVTYSFPSGHAVNGLMFIMVLYSCFHRFFHRHFFLLGLCLIWLIAIGWSRLAMGTHWCSDILGGWGCAMMWMAFML